MSSSTELCTHFTAQTQEGACILARSRLLSTSDPVTTSNAYLSSRETICDSGTNVLGGINETYSVAPPCHHSLS